MSNEKPSFFKVLIKHSTDQLVLPPHFSRNYGVNLPEIVKLRAHDGREWKVKVERLDGGVLGFTRGWKAFAEDVALERGEFIVFTLLAESKLAVFIYENTFCEREIPVIIPPTPTTTTTSSTSTTPHHAACSSTRRNDVVPKRRTRSSTMKSSKSDNPLYFEVCLKPYNKSRINLPMEFWKAGGMKEKKMKSVMMEFVATGACESVAVDHPPQKNRVDLTKGWSKFREENGLEFGKNYSFHFIPNLNRILVNSLHKQV